MRLLAIFGFIITSNVCAFLNGRFPTRLLQNHAHMTTSSNDDTPSSSRPKSFHTYLSDLFNSMDVDSSQTRNFIPKINPNNQLVEKYLKMIDELHQGKILLEFITMTPLYIQLGARDLVSTILGILPGCATDSKIFISKTKLKLILEEMQLAGYTLKSVDYHKPVDESIEGNTHVILQYILYWHIL